MTDFEKKAQVAAFYQSSQGLSEMKDSRSLAKAMEIGFFRGACWARETFELDLLKIRTALRVQGATSEYEKKAIEASSEIGVAPDDSAGQLLFVAGANWAQRQHSAETAKLSEPYKAIFKYLKSQLDKASAEIEMIKTLAGQDCGHLKQITELFDKI